jgi:hypothetical protein
MAIIILVLLILGAVFFFIEGFGLASHPRFRFVALGLLVWIIAVILEHIHV